MNKKTRNLYITILTIVTVVAILFGSYIHLFRGVRFGVFTGKQASDSITFHDTVTDLDIDADAANLTLRYGDALTVSYEMPEECIPEITLQDGTLKIHNLNNKTSIGFPTTKSEIVITLPQDCTIDTASYTLDAGNLTINNIGSREATFDVDAGNIEVSTASFQTMNIDCDAGNVSIISCTIDTIEAKIDAGNITAADCTITNGSCDVDLGNITLSGEIGEVETNASLGTVNVN